MNIETPKKQKIVKTFSDTNYFAKGTYKRDFLDIFSTSFLANIFTKTALAPLERWRIIKQTQRAYQHRPNKIKTFSQYLSKMPKEQGWLSFWRGNGANCWLQFWQVFSQIFLFDSIKNTFNQYSYELRQDIATQFLFDRILAPILAASTCLLITHPIDTARIRLSMNYYRNPKQILFTGIVSCWSLIRLESRSLRGIYQGYLLAILINTINLNIYTTFRDIWNQANLFSKNKQIGDLICSKQSFGTLIALLLLHPLDSIKKNLQLNNQNKPQMFKTSRQVLSYYRQMNSSKQLFSGLTVALIRQVIFWPIFILSLNFLQRQVNKF